MRINEIITESLDEETLDEYASTDFRIVKALKEKGYRYLGSGVDQTAFMEPGTGFVLKIFGTDETHKFSGDHKMFFKWAKFCEKNQGNKFLPRFYGHESFLWPDAYDADLKNRYLMIRTEPLKNSGHIGAMLSRMTYNIVEGDTVRTVLGYVKETNPKSYNKLVQQFGEDGIAQFLTTAKKLHAIGERAGYEWDLHDGNIMMRSDGTPVINDPWVLG